MDINKTILLYLSCKNNYIYVHQILWRAWISRKIQCSYMSYKKVSLTPQIKLFPSKFQYISISFVCFWRLQGLAQTNDKMILSSQEFSLSLPALVILSKRSPHSAFPFHGSSPPAQTVTLSAFTENSRPFLLSQIFTPGTERNLVSFYCSFLIPQFPLFLLHTHPENFQA